MSGEPSFERVWAICPYTAGRDLKDCALCPPVEYDDDHGMVSRGCYRLAVELINIVETGHARRVPSLLAEEIAIRQSRVTAYIASETAAGRTPTTDDAGIERMLRVAEGGK
jgi:hypothetical protein